LKTNPTSIQPASCVGKVIGKVVGEDTPDPGDTEYSSNRQVSFGPGEERVK
jgi:hypothetical protein